MTTTSPFTWQDGLDLQSFDLRKWQRLLKPEAYEKLKTRVSNETADTFQWCIQLRINSSQLGYYVPRGQKLTEIVLNMDI